ncbi:MAG: SAM-dependent methyltransferase [Planctomycetota bacterium]|jgi:cyclopropane-fatty-acyl-phospholipid synthase
MSVGIALAERGLVPDWLTRTGIRGLLRTRLTRERAAQPRRDFQRSLIDGPLAPVPEKANEQHYEVPAEFFGLVLGKHRKYSSAHWDVNCRTLDEAAADMLALTCARAEIEDGQEILELGCGWGSLTLWMARRYPKARITAVSNSASQRAFIQSVAPDNVRVITADMNDFEPRAEFDRIVSVEMFEHMRNYRLLFERVSSWLRPAGKLFVHVFCHREFAYPFETEGSDNWMGRYFFTGGQMPSFDLLGTIQDSIPLEESWAVDGTHYAQTSEAWLRNLDNRRAEVMPVLERTYGKREAARWFQRWRIFFLACAELFGYESGKQWIVGHYRFAKP